MKSLFSWLGVLIFGVVLLVIVNLVLFLPAINEKKQYRKLVDVCVFETKKKADEPNNIKIDYENSYVIDTSNPDIWMIHLDISKTENSKVLTGKVYCRVRRTDGNLNVTSFSVIST